MPQSCWNRWQARVLARDVAGGRLDRDVQGSGGYAGGQGEGAGQAGPVPAPVEQQLGRAGRDDQPGRVAPSVVELLTARRVEGDDQLDRARRRTRRGPLGLPGRTDDLLRVGRDRHADQAVGRGLDDDEAGGRRRRPARPRRRWVRRARWPAWRPGSSPGRTGGSPRCRCRRPPPSRPEARRRPAGAAAGHHRPGRRDGRSRTARFPPASSAPRPTRSAGRTSRSRRPTPGDRRRTSPAPRAGPARRCRRGRLAALPASSRPEPRAGRAPGRDRASVPRAGGCPPWRRRPGRPTTPGPRGSRGPGPARDRRPPDDATGHRFPRPRGYRCPTTRFP